MISKGQRCPFNLPGFGTTLEVRGRRTEKQTWEDAREENQEKPEEAGEEMGRANILICPSCDYKRHLTEAETVISYALVVACLKCGSAMQCVPRGTAAVPGNGKGSSTRDSLRIEAV